MIKAIMLDLDDTLIVNEALYDHARASLAGYLRHFGISADKVHAAIDCFDADLFKTLGVSQQRYPQTYERVLRHFVPDADNEMIGIARSFAEDVFLTIAPVKPGVAEALEFLAQHYDLYLVTAGDKDVQNRRILHLPFADLFQGIHVVDKKDTETFKACLARENRLATETVMVGDSLKSDILPSVAAGMKGVWIEVKTSTSFHPLNHTADDEIPASGIYRFSSLLEFARHIAGHGMLEGVEIPPPSAEKKESKKGGLSPRRR